MSDLTIQPATGLKLDHVELDESFLHLNAHLANTVWNRLGQNKFHAFQTRLGRNDLFDAYLAAFPDAIRQEHNCNCCKAFLRAVGGLVTIDAEGKQSSVLWDENMHDEPYKASVRAMRLLVEKATVDKVFYAPSISAYMATVFGAEKKGGYAHFCLSVNHFRLAPTAAKSTGSQMLDSKQDYIFLKKSMQEFSNQSLDLAIKLFANDVHLKHYPRHLANLVWLQELRAKVKHSSVGKQLIWREVASQPPGRIRLRNTVMGTLLLGLDAGVATEVVKKAFLAMVDPKDYMRPKAAPSVGNIEQAERIVKTLGIERSLERRWARLDEIPAAAYLWQPSVPEAAAQEGGVFGHLAPKSTGQSAASTAIDGGIMTWARFEAEVLPHAKTVEMVMEVHRSYNFVSLTTAVHPDAPPILRWDSLEARNPFSGYAYAGGSRPSAWNLPVSAIMSRVPILGIVPQPETWNRAAGEADVGASRILILEGARDMTGFRNLALFPANMREELYEIRATIEAHSASKGLEGGEEGMGGVSFGDGTVDFNYRLFVTDGKFTTSYLIDRYM